MSDGWFEPDPVEDGGTPEAGLRHLGPDAAGVDEAGRGTWAGPVVAAAVVLPDGFDRAGLDDSKRLDAAAREALAARIRAGARWAVAEVDAAVIDRTDILRATFRAMREALAGLGEPAPASVWIDGDRLPPGVGRATAVVKGDGRIACIAAASILAKTWRDARMAAYDAEFPGWGFDRHFGYGTADHREALLRLGASPIHRRSFAPVRDVVDQTWLRMDA